MKGVAADTFILYELNEAIQAAKRSVEMIETVDVSDMTFEDRSDLEQERALCLKTYEEAVAVALSRGVEVAV